MPGIWQARFAFAKEQHGTPVVIGEFGGLLTAKNYQDLGRSPEGAKGDKAWHEALVRFVKANGVKAKLNIDHAHQAALSEGGKLHWCPSILTKHSPDGFQALAHFTLP